MFFLQAVDSVKCDIFTSEKSMLCQFLIILLYLTRIPKEVRLLAYHYLPAFLAVLSSLSPTTTTIFMSISQFQLNWGNIQPQKILVSCKICECEQLEAYEVYCHSLDFIDLCPSIVLR